MTRVRGTQRVCLSRAATPAARNSNASFAFLHHLRVSLLHPLDFSLWILATYRHDGARRRPPARQRVQCRTTSINTALVRIRRPVGRY